MAIWTGSWVQRMNEWMEELTWKWFPRGKFRLPHSNDTWVTPNTNITDTLLNSIIQNWSIFINSITFFIKRQSLALFCITSLNHKASEMTTKREHMAHVLSQSIFRPSLRDSFSLKSGRERFLYLMHTETNTHLRSWIVARCAVCEIGFEV